MGKAKETGLLRETVSSFLVVGDIHGAEHWKAMLKGNPAERVYILGDFCDSYDHSHDPRKSLGNMRAILRRARKDRSIRILVGNHDYHYMGFTDSEYSRFDRELAKEYGKVLADNRDLLHMACVADTGKGKPILISHAGVSRTFLKMHRLTVDTLDRAWRERPEIFDFVYFNPKVKSNDPLALMMGRSEGTGDDLYQSPIWIRPNALINDMIPGYHQIVGHTNISKPCFIKFKGKNLVIVCSPGKENYFTLEMYRNYRESDKVVPAKKAKSEGRGP